MIAMMISPEKVEKQVLNRNGELRLASDHLVRGRPIGALCAVA
jgi:hypothetical protein